MFGARITIFVAALSVRWIYDLAIYAAMGTDGVMSVDSGGYLGSAETFVAAMSAGSLSGFQWLGLNLYVMPLFHWLVTLCVLAFGSSAPLAYVLGQGLLDAATCIAIYQMASMLDPRWAKPAGIFAAINPCQIVLAGLLYTDTPFLFFAAFALLGTLWWMRAPSWAAVLLMGFAIGAAALTRSLMLPWAAATFAFLLIVGVSRKTLTPRALAQLAAMAGIVLLSIAPVIARNVTQYGVWAFTPQGGQHLNRWVVPLIKEAHDGTPWIKSYEELEQRAQQRFGRPDQNPFVQSRHYTEIAMEELRSFALRDIAKAWIYGAALNVGSPAVILSPPLSSLPRTGFYSTPGQSWLEKLGNFVFHGSNALYASMLLLGIAGVLAIRLVQFAGFVQMLTRPALLPELLLLAGWCLFILAVNGPVASPKYRLPMEPALVIWSAAGWIRLRSWVGPRGQDARV